MIPILVGVENNCLQCTVHTRAAPITAFAVPTVNILTKIFLRLRFGGKQLQAIPHMIYEIAVINICVLVKGECVSTKFFLHRPL